MQGMLAGKEAKTKMGERHHGCVWCDESSKQSGGGLASISQRHLGSDVLTRIMLREEEGDHWLYANPAVALRRKYRNRRLISLVYVILALRADLVKKAGKDQIRTWIVAKTGRHFKKSTTV